MHIHTLNYKSIGTVERYIKRDVFASIMLSIARICLPSRTTRRVHTSSHQSNSKHISLCNLYNSISSSLMVQHWSHYLADYYILHFPLHLTWIRKSNGNWCFCGFDAMEENYIDLCFVCFFNTILSASTAQQSTARHESKSMPRARSALRSNVSHSMESKPISEPVNWKPLKINSRI